jgi:hypothetical protein
MTEPLLLALCAVLAVLVIGLAVALRRSNQRTAQEFAALERRFDAFERTREAEAVGLTGFETGASAPSSTNDGASAPSSTSVDGEYVITRIGNADADVAEVVDPPDAKLFADIVLRETVVKAASFAHGVRRGLSPEIRNKMWFEMRREVRRARKQRRADHKEAQREWKARQRAALDEDDAA